MHWHALQLCQTMPKVHVNCSQGSWLVTRRPTTTNTRMHFWIVWQRKRKLEEYFHASKQAPQACWSASGGWLHPQSGCQRTGTSRAACLFALVRLRACSKLCATNACFLTQIHICTTTYQRSQTKIQRLCITVRKSITFYSAVYSPSDHLLRPKTATQRNLSTGAAGWDLDILLLRNPHM